MRKFIFFLFLLSICFQVRSQITYYSCDFQSDAKNVPSDMTVYDLDRLTPTEDLTGAGFEVGKGWIVLSLAKGDMNLFAGSTSSYKEVGTANDWMITPLIGIHQKGAMLTWKGLVPDKSDKRDGYQVRVSTKGVAVEDFDEAPIFSIDEESSEGWVQHSVSLDEYAGKEIYIAFINNSTDKYVLGIDDIMVTGPAPIAHVTGVNTNYTDQEGATIEGKITNDQDTPITSFTAYYKADDVTYSKEFTGLNLKKGESYEFKFDDKLPIELSKTKSYSIWAKVGEVNLIPQNKTLTRLTFIPQQKVVIEEGTGIWCANCTRGMAIMDFMKEHYKENFIAVAAHGTDTQDPMADLKYGSSLGINSYPSGYVNRKVLLAPLVMLNDTTYTSLVGRSGDYGFEYGLLNELAEGTYASVDLEAEITDVDNLKIEYTIKSTFGMDIKNGKYRFSLLIIENNVQNKSYNQSNNSAGFSGYWETSAGIEKGLGGYEKLPSIIKGKDIVYNDVARELIGDFQGIKNSITATSITAGQTVEYKGTADLSNTDTGIFNPRSTEIIAMLIDQKTNAIVNANIVNIGADDIASTVQNGFNVEVLGGKNGCNVLVNSDRAQEVTVELLDVNGKLIASDRGMVEGNQNFGLVNNAPKGIYIVRVCAGDQVITKKVAL